ncbi:MAG TPA: DUF1330 domain-containing protein [Bacteroidales bacterium]|nr:DUF1330 domain-containing protein [Bacteroidales bacterium]
MNYYFLAQIRINVGKEYQKYLSKLVLIRFNSKKDFEDWYHSEEYQNILKHRLKAAGCDTLLLKGLNK